MKKKPENSNFLYPTFQYCVIGDYEVLKNPYFRRLEIEKSANCLAPGDLVLHNSNVKIIV